MAVVYWPEPRARSRIGNLMASYPALQYLTWLLQVMPLFFAFGGAVERHRLAQGRRGRRPYSAWMWGRVRRLLRPVLVYLAIMAVFGAVMTLFVGPRARSAALIINGPLWFLGVYTMTLLFLPFMWWVHQHNRAIAFVVLVPLAVIDSVGVTILGWPVWIGFLNFLSVLAGHPAARLLLGRGHPAAHVGDGRGPSFVVNAALVYYGPWPMSLVGLPGDVLDYDAAARPRH